MRNGDKIAEDLYAAMSEMWIIDSHEHLPPETDRLAMKVDAVSLFENYPMFDLKAAGMSDDEYLTMTDRERPLDDRWEILAGYLPFIWNTSFTRSALLGVQQLYGYDDITAENYGELSEVMQAANRPGIYRRVFHDHGRVVVALNQVYPQLWDGPPEPGNFRVPQMWEDQLNIAFGTEPLDWIEAKLGQPACSLDEYVKALEILLRHYRDKGVVGVKLAKATPIQTSQAPDVTSLYERVAHFRADTPTSKRTIRATEWRRSVVTRRITNARQTAQELLLSGTEKTALRDYVAHAIIRIAGQLGMVIIQHSGHLGVWNDYRLANPVNLIPVFTQHPGVRFELYHAGMPWVREVGMIAKAFPNVWLNMCWAHSLSRQMARSALDEWLDLVPANKIIVFGGDTFLWVEWALGELVQARENLAAVLAKRIRERLITEERALDLARMMLYENPRNLYGLQCQPSDEILYE